MMMPLAVTHASARSGDGVVTRKIAGTSGSFQGENISDSASFFLACLAAMELEGVALDEI
jgi:hypothetical protein